MVLEPAFQAVTLVVLITMTTEVEINALLLVELVLLLTMMMEAELDVFLPENLALLHIKTMVLDKIVFQ